MSKRTETFVYSIGGVILLLVILVVANMLFVHINQRLDLSEGKRYTLSDGTRTVLGNLKEPVKLRYYFSRDDGVPLPLKAFGERVDTMLGQFRDASGGKLTIERLDPQPDSDAEDTAQLDGVQPQNLPNGDNFFLGIAIGEGDKRLAIPALSLDREELLEYDIARTIARAGTPEKPVIGVMTGMPLFGSRGNPMFGMPPTEKQVIIHELERDFTVKRVAQDATAIEGDIKVLLVVHPRSITEQGKYAIDQFVMRGGKLIAMVDPFAYFDAPPSQDGKAQGTVSNLDTLFKAWGVGFDSTKVLQDAQYVSGGGPQALPTLLSLVGAAFNSADVTTSRMQTALIPFAGAFTGTPAEGLTSTPLLKSSGYSRLVPSEESMATGEAALKDFKPSTTEFPIALRLTGKFKTAYPDGAPPLSAEELKKAEEAKKAADAAAAAAPAAAAGQAPAAAPPAAPLKESGENSVILIADADFISDGAAVQIQEIFGQRIVVPANGNLAFVQAMIDQFAGDENLIALRGRASPVRPFTVIRDMEARVQQTYIGKITELQAAVQESTQKLQALQPPRAGGQPAASSILTPEQQAEVDKLRQTAAKARLELKEVRKELRADTEALEFWTKLANIALIPLLVALAGLLLAFVRTRRTVTV